MQNKLMKSVLLTSIFMLLSIMSLYANNTKITIKLKDSTLEVFFKEIEKQTGLTVMLNNVDLNQSLSVDAVDSDLNALLTQVLTSKSILYKIVGNKIVLNPVSQVAKGKAKTSINNISGQVLDSFDEPLMGVSIMIDGTNIGTTTDIDGKYSLSVPESATIVFSYIGFVTQRVKVQKERVVNIVLIENQSLLDEVVVVGYGTQKKSNITGSVASIKTEDFKDLNMGVAGAIQGRVAGVNVSNGSIIIRGAASINGAAPLWIVDGVPGSEPNMNDIESIEILKDAASTAIYGARGAGGVILVTTKRGSKGKLAINARANLGVSLVIDQPKMLRTADFIDRKLAAGFPNNPNSGWDNPSSLPDTNWTDLVWRNGFNQNYFVQMTGGSEATTFNISSEFNKREDVERRAFSEGGNIRIASQTNIGKRIKVSEVVTLGFKNEAPPAYKDLGIQRYREVPTMTPYDIENSSGGGWGKLPPGGYYEGVNPLTTIMTRHVNEKTYYGKANLILDYEVIDNLKFQANLTGNFNSYGFQRFQESWNLGSVSYNERYTKDYSVGHDLRMLYTLSYDRTFADKHYLKGLVGYEASKALSSNMGGWKTGFLIQPAEDMGLGTGNKDVNGGKKESRSLSQFARLNYAYDDKYMFETSIRRDGYDNFGPENRFGIFPSASVGWNVARESFITDNANLHWLTQLKLRGSIGKIGNNTVAQFLYEPAFTNEYLFYSYDGEVVERGFWYANIANPAIKWEDVTQWNVGIDASFLKSRLNVTLEYYDKHTTNMLYGIGVPPSAGSMVRPFDSNKSYMANIGEIKNKGFEMMVQWRDSYKEFNYDIAFTLSTNSNKVTKLSDQINPIIWAGANKALNTSIYRTENGRAMGQMYGYIVEGIFKNQAEIDALNAASPDGVYQQVGTAPGDLKYKDLDGSGKISVDDKTFIGSPWAKMIYGLNVNLSWKGFDLSMGWLANTGSKIFNSAKIYERNFYGDYNTTYKVFDAWTPENINSKHPRVIKEDPNGNFKNVSSYFVEDGSFLKLKNLHVGYNLPKSFLSKFNIQGLKVFVNADNLLIISKFQGDPEIGGGYLERNHYSDIRIPSMRTITGGISLTL